ncbi:ATP-dependent metallopeptidase FtsH/Yme1/Tma family protein [Actinotalea solisilvae]|uniref:ATP-dependent metallopeptidase FtsH/Yme1/Tma family protein n=1 Tax=Actinotalea solisilvae TaxID=2072922 RepID=UPI0018F22812|nr:AAA family ATPase [Actinotalea solisilvae]
MTAQSTSTSVPAVAAPPAPPSTAPLVPAPQTSARRRPAGEASPRLRPGATVGTGTGGGTGAGTEGAGAPQPAPGRPARDHDGVPAPEPAPERRPDEPGDAPRPPRRSPAPALRALGARVAALLTDADPATPWWRRRRVLAAVAVVVLLASGAWGVLSATAEPAPERIALTEALALVAEGDVTAATVDDRAAEVVLVTSDDALLAADFPADYADELTQTLVDAGVPLDAEAGERGAAADLASRLLPVLIIVGVLLLVLRGLNPQGALGGRPRKALASGEIPAVTFADVAGADEAVDQLSEMVQFLREPERFEAVGATRPRGALLVGPPGTGKTLLARAVAGEAQVPFFALAGSDFVESFVGVGARRVRDLFAEARKAERAIIFIDEIDAVGRARGGASGNGGDGERENTLISLLNEMDGFVGSHIIVLAATNRADTLDPALTRPGRLDRQVQVPNPDRRGRTLILQVHARSRPVADDVDLVQIARQTPGMSGADLAQVVNEACMEAARQGQDVVDAACFQAAVATVAMGRARTSALVTEYDRMITAWHEAGHTLAAALLPDADDPVSVTIVPRGPAGGITWMSGNDDVFLPRRKALAQLVVALAGRAAEERLLDGEYTQGASGDLRGATDLATKMVTQYGMTDFGYAQVDAETMRVGGQVAAQAHAAVDRLLRDAHVQATELLTAHAPLLEAVAAALLVEETLTARRVREIIAEFEAVPEP